VLSDALLEDIRTNCPNIEELILESFYLDHISSSKLPLSLIHFTARECHWPVAWLKGACLANLQSLTIESCVRVDQQELVDVASLSSLESLTLSNMYRVKNAGIQTIAENLTGLQCLELNKLAIDDLAVHHICRNLKSLKELVLCETDITNSAVETIFVSLPELKKLDVSGHKNLDSSILTCSLKSKSLSEFTFSLSEVDPDVLDKISMNFPRRILKNTLEK